jgi:uncharacterized membrane protein
MAVPIAGYALAYVIVGERMYPSNLAASFLARPWGIYPHALFGSIALGLGALQFNRWLLLRHRPLHRALGTVYVVSAMIVGLAGLYMSIYTFGGPVTHLGFGTLAVLLLWTTTRAYLAARERTCPEGARDPPAVDAAELRPHLRRRHAAHRLPLLIMAFGEFTPAYQVVAWLSWVPNLLWAEWYVRRTANVPVPSPERLRPA